MIQEMNRPVEGLWATFLVKYSVATRQITLIPYLPIGVGT